MRHHSSLCACAFVLSVLVAGGRQAEAQATSPADAPIVAGQPAATVTASARRLERIARRLHGPSPLRTADASRVDFAMRVNGETVVPPQVAPGDLAIGAPVYGSPTHDEMLTLATPAPFRSTAPYRRYRPAVPLGR